MDERLSAIITQSVNRTLEELRMLMPQIQPQVEEWMRSLSGGYAPEEYFKHPIAFPTLLLPWWVGQSLERESALEFHRDLVYSSINGYYFIRMIDNVMDEGAAAEKKLLPALAFFHTEFQTAYQKYFPVAHPFWGEFRGAWFGSHQAAIVDAQLTEIDLHAFENMAAQKVSAARIPVAAACHYFNRAEAAQDWFELAHSLGKWSQMYNDLFDWHKDSAHGAQTYFIYEADRLKNVDETIAQWVAREGFAHGCDILRGWMKESRDLAAGLNCPELTAHLNDRAALFEDRAKKSFEGLRVLDKLAEAALK